MNIKSRQEQVRATAQGIRGRVLEHTLRNDGGYLSQACSSAEIFASLYTEIMNLGPVAEPLRPPSFFQVPGPHSPFITGAQFNGPAGPDYDKFFLSPSQYSLVLYATLIETGRMTEDGMEQFNQDGSTVEMIGAQHSPGMEIMSGSLGQGLSQAAGIAWGRKRKEEKGKVWVFMSDGEFQIGQTWEALQAMCFYKLDNVGIYVDVNGQQCDGRTETVMNVEPLDQRLRAFGAEVYKVAGHDPEALVEPASKPRNGRPLMVLAYTNPWQGIEILKERAPRLHYIRFSNEAERERYREYLKK